MKYKILELLRSSNDYVSGQDIAHKFNVTRTSVWKSITKLKEEGYNIGSVNNRGYIFKDTEDILNAHELGEDIKCVFRDKVSSTNDIAKELAYKGCEEMLVVTCNSQYSGKGRLGRQWTEADKDGVYMSVVLRPVMTPSEAPQLTLVTGISVCEAIREITDLPAYIKWPNDIVINGRKVVGILTEMSAEVERIKYVVVGIGVNLNQTSFPEEISDKATSIFLECEKKYRRKTMICGIMKRLKENYALFCESGFPALREKYISFCINMDKNVNAIKNNKVLAGKVSDINDRGELILTTQDGKIVTIDSGEVSLRSENNKYI